jgi:very-short-patch-repair endonuclease
VVTVDAEVMRLFARHQWVRDHDMPRVSVLIGAVTRCAASWQGWLALSGRVSRHAIRGIDGIADAIAAAAASPREPIAIAVTPDQWHAWCDGRDDRVKALAAEGAIEIAGDEVAPEPVVRVPERRKSDRRKLDRRKTDRRGENRRAAGRVGVAGIDNPRSLAELTLHEALEATPATAGKFRLNQFMPFRFGGSDCEVDLLAREDAIAIEVDGIHHFGDPDCYRRDRRKDLLLQAHGLAVLRFLADDVLADPAGAVKAVVELMGHRLRLKERT